VEYLTRLRRERRLTQTQLAQRVGVSRQAVQNWEAGRAWPRARCLRALCDVLGVRPDELLSAAERARVFGEDD
jgi:transcriptional regulator with XRE-family HTH domain